MGRKLAQSVQVLSVPHHDRVDVAVYRHAERVRLRVEFVSEQSDASQALTIALDPEKAASLHSQLGRALGIKPT